MIKYLLFDKGILKKYARRKESVECVDSDISFLNMYSTIRTLARKSPRVYFAFNRYSERPSDGSYRRLTRRHDIVIDAYPRSANTFATFAFILAQSQRTMVAHHFHAPAALVRASRLGIPALTIVRKPEDAILSYAIFMGRRRLTRAIDDYLSYYGVLAERKDLIYVAKFEDVVEDFGNVVKAMNEFFCVGFDVPDMTPEFTKMVQNHIIATYRKAPPQSISNKRDRQLPLPSNWRQELKGKYMEELLGKRYFKTFLKCDALYKEIMTAISVQRRSPHAK